MKEQILNSVPGVKGISLFNHTSMDANVDTKIFKIEDLLIVDNDFFRIFNLHFIRGDRKNALKSEYDVVITTSAAKRILGSDDVIGKAIKLNHKTNMIVRGIVTIYLKI